MHNLKTKQKTKQKTHNPILDQSGMTALSIGPGGWNWPVMGCDACEMSSRVSLNIKIIADKSSPEVAFPP